MTVARVERSAARELDRANVYGDTQRSAPYAEAVQSLAGQGFQRLHVPGHQGSPDHMPELADAIGSASLALDLPMLFSQIDQRSWQLGERGITPLTRSLALAAEAWGAQRAWFLTNGASMGNQIASLAARALSPSILAQRSMHSSAIHGMILAGLEPHFIHPAIDPELGVAHGVAAEQVEHALRELPDVGAVYLVSPSYFGAAADLPRIATVCHERGVPLIVDESWGSHFGFHPGVPQNAIRSGADLVISSSHKSIGSLTQSAMLFLGHGPLADRLGAAVDRVFQTVQSTSSSSLLMMSLDEARRRMVLDRGERLGDAIADADAIRDGIAARGRFQDAGPRMRESPDVVGLDPLKVVIDTRIGGVSGNEAHHRLLRDHRIYLELATPSVVVALVGAQSRADVPRLLDALHRLPQEPDGMESPLPLPQPGERRLDLRSAYFSPVELVPAAEAVGRLSADALAAYPPGIPNVLPGEELTAEMVQFFQATASTATGHVRGAPVADCSVLRVLGSG